MRSRNKLCRGKNELSTASKEINAESVRNFLLSQDCDLIEFKLNVPCASHMDGIWKRLIRTVRSVLSGLSSLWPRDDHAQQLDDEALRTLFTEAENIVNSRPLTIGTRAHYTKSPANLQDESGVTPSECYRVSDLDSRRWRRIQYLSDQFWHRWQLEYCLLQQKRQKWNNLSPNSRVDDIVLMLSESCPRNQWPLARVMKVYPSDDGLVRKVLLLVTQSGERKFFERPIHKLILIYRPEEGESDN